MMSRDLIERPDWGNGIIPYTNGQGGDIAISRPSGSVYAGTEEAALAANYQQVAHILTSYLGEHGAAELDAQTAQLPRHLQQRLYSHLRCPRGHRMTPTAEELQTFHRLNWGRELVARFGRSRAERMFGAYISSIATLQAKDSEEDLASWDAWWKILDVEQVIGIARMVSG